MPIVFIRNASKLSLLFLLIFQFGCATHKEYLSHWRNFDICANGINSEWPFSPQYWEKEQNVFLRIANDNNAVFLNLSSGNDLLNGKLRMTGLTIWLDPAGGKEKVFGIHLPGEHAKIPWAGSRPIIEGIRPNDELGLSPNNSGSTGMPGPPPKLPETLYITYKNSTGPLDMTIDEVGKTGIFIGIGQLRNNKLTYEFTIGFRAAPCLSSLKPGWILGIGIQTGSGNKKNRGHRHNNAQVIPGIDWEVSSFGTGMKPPSSHPAGGMSGGPGMQAPGKKYDPFEIWLKAQLVGQCS